MHSLTYGPDTILRSEDFAKVPATWILNPALIDLAPRVYQWYLSKSGNQELGAMMGDGSPESDRFTGFKFYCELTKKYMERAQMYSLKQMRRSEAVNWRVQPYLFTSGYSGRDSRGLGPYEYHMDEQAFHIGNIDIIDGESAPIRKVVENSPPDQPLFLTVFAGTMAGDTPANIKKVADELLKNPEDKKYHFLRGMDLAATYRSWKGLPVNNC